MDFSIVLKNRQILRGILLMPSDNPRAIIILVHGIGEHSRRYTYWAELFSAEGIGFLCVDLPGHGRSDGMRGHISKYSIFAEMIDTLFDITEKTYPEVPVFIYGHSLGGGIVLDYLIREKRPVRGAIVTSPWLRLSFEPSALKQSIAVLVKNIFPALVQPTGLIVSDISHDKDVVNEYMHDPLVHDKISVNLFHGAIKSGKNSLKNASSINVPVLMLHGLDDRITSPEASREFAAANSLVTIRFWDGGYHELHNEPFKKDVFNCITGWINDNLM